ncbi:Gfo/Idh/MocA family oxidoreductase [Cohnella herbarum]|uniref:Gfo/Idh/MocA family oxidoreductase n=1 Tax=Cohnella herbarum TaxID=2728023 RepID=A0A7Z2VKC5_9BACL|nr:Gfo/Idh/MocA family oxidoreductase [Cohnella herbarum]QJD84565.1 Gfo/Idh/MocA family oxidoreductase [Cohnella herbarum]
MKVAIVGAGSMGAVNAEAHANNPNAEPTYLHKENVLKAASYGKHVICEKPITGNFEEARTMNNKPKLLLIGLEGLNHWPGFPEFDTVGIVDLYNEANESSWLLEELEKLPLYSSLDEALEHTSPDVAVVSVPGGGKTTIDAEAKLLASGIDVLAKKLRLNAMNDVDRLKQACDQGSGRLYVGEHYHYLPSVRSLKKAVQDGKLGDIVQVTWRCLLPYEKYDWMKGYRHLAMEDLAYHHLGVLHDVFGFHPSTVYAQSYEPSFSQSATRTVVSMLAETEEGYRLNYQTVWCSKLKPFSYLGELSVEGSQGSVELTEKGLKLYSYFGRKRKVEQLDARYDGPWGLLSEWLEFTAGSTGSPFTFQSFEPVLRAIYRAVESSERRIVM